MQINEAALDQLNRYTVAIEKAGSDSVLGTGVIVTDDGLLLTCYHVVGNIKTKTLDKTVDIYFPELKSTKPADIVEQYCNPSLDIAFLKLKEDQKLPDKIAVANLGETVSFGHKFASMGFRKSNMFEKLSSGGEIRIKTSYKTKEGVESLGLVQLYSDEIEKGMSGAPVLDLDTNKVIGIISDHYSTEGNVDAKLNFAIPIQSVIRVYPDLRNKNSGLLKIHQFMQAIAKSGSLIYDRFEDVYVPPIEYEEIRKILEDYRCIFITGTPEYGKTYTAIKLLWEYYKNGYTPQYIDEGSKEATDIIKKLVNLDKKSLENNIIYIEDPVGKTQYKANKEFEESVGSIISGLGNLNAYLIVTMREEIYQKFNPIGKEDLKQHIKKLNIANDSYDYERRKEMLLRWADIMNCKWIQDEHLKTAVLEYIKNDEAKLPTPLNIKDFIMETTKNSNIINEEQLLKIVNKQSQRTPERFAKDIIEMEKHGETNKILFLCFPFISNWLSYDFVKNQYNKLLKNFNMKDDYVFERVSTLFQDKIEFRDYVRFSHPSYSEALSYILLDENGIPTKINTQIYSKMLIRLSDIDRNTWISRGLCKTLSENFDKLPEKIRNELLIKLADKEGSDIASIIVSNFDKLPRNVQNLLFKIADNNKVISTLANILSLNFDKLPEKIRNELLIKLADNNEKALKEYEGTEIPADEYPVRFIASAIAENFDKLPENVQNLLFKLEDSKHSDLGIMSALAENFDKLPENVIQKLLFKIADKEGMPSYMAFSYIPSNFDKLPEKIRNELLIKLADKKEEAIFVASIVAENFDKLPENAQNLLFKLADDKEIAPAIVLIVFYKFDKLPENVIQKLLLKVASDKEIASHVADTVAKNFDKISDNERNLLFKILPENIRNQILRKLEKEQ